MTDLNRPILIPLDGPAAQPADAPALPDALAQGAAMRGAARLAGGGGLGRWVLGAALALISFVAGLMFWDWLTALLVRAPVLGWIGAALAGLLAGVVLLWVLRELAGLARLRRLDRIQAAARLAADQGDLRRAQAVVADLAALYAGRAEVRAGLDAAQAMDTADGGALLALADRAVVGPLDARALLAVEQAARTVAATTALVPLPLADIGTALVANLRMIGQVAQIYGGRGGMLGSWRLTRAVMAHLVATGALAVGEDLIGAAGGGLIARLSRRFGEGVVNGALTVRVGLAAMDLCRPLPWAAGARPGLTAVLGRAVRGLFQQEAAG